MVYSVTRSFYHQLVSSGVHIFEWTPGFCHAKMSIADDRMATCGTINLDYRSLYHHFENGCFMADCDAVLDIRNDLHETMKECREVNRKISYRTQCIPATGTAVYEIVCGICCKQNCLDKSVKISI